MNWRNHPRVKLAARALLNGEVVAYPTEAVWGLGCLPDQRLAVQKILSLKARPQHKGLILVAGSMAQIAFLLCDIEDKQHALLKQSWPGHTTWLLPQQNLIPSYVTGQHASVAVRISAHPVVQALCAEVDGPIVSTSANPSGLRPAKKVYRVKQYFGDCVEYAPGQVGCHDRPSIIKDLLTGAILRV